MPILSSRLRLAEHARQNYHASPRADDKPEDVLDPKYWVHVAGRLRAGDKIEMLWESGTFYAEAVVLDAGQYGAKIAFTMEPVSLVNDAKVEEPEGFEVAWAGPHAKWRVTRVADKAVLKDQIASKEDGLAWVRAHRKAMAA